MDYVVRGRGGGKTSKLLQWAATKMWNDEFFYIVCMNHREAERINGLLCTFGADSGWKVLAPPDLVFINPLAPVAIDNLDLMLDEIPPNILKRAELVTVTGNWR